MVCPRLHGRGLGASRYDGLLTLLLYGGIFLGVSAFGEWKKYYVYLLAVSASICSLVAIPQLLGGNPFGLYPGELTYFDANVRYTGEFLGTIGNTNLLAAFYCLCIPLFAWQALTGRQRRERLLLIPAALCLGVLIASRVASGLVATAAAVVVLVPYYVNYTRHSPRLTALAAAAMAALCAAGLAAVYLYPGQSGTLYELSQLLHGRVDDSFGSSRVAIWRECLHLVGESPLNLGVLGLAPYLFLCYVNLKRFFTASGGAPAALGGALGCYLVQSLFGLGLCLVVPLVWIYMGLICSPQEDKKCKNAP